MIIEVLKVFVEVMRLITETVIVTVKAMRLHGESLWEGR
jgi:hypothetical protein